MLKKYGKYPILKRLKISVSDIYPIFSSSKISDIFDIFKIGYFLYFFNITLLLDVKTSLKCETDIYIADIYRANPVSGLWSSWCLLPRPR